MPFAMISQPMGGLTDDEIMQTRKKSISKLYLLGYITQDTLLDFPDNIAKNKPLYCLGESLKLMADCDLAYFCKGWEKARGCRIEHEAAVAYGLDILYEN